MSTLALPWTPSQVRLLVGGNVAGIALLAVAVAGSAGSGSLDDQIGWLNLAVVALLVGVAANAGWLLGARRAVGRRRHQVLPDVAVVTSQPVEGVGSHDLDAWVWLPGTTRGHRPGCLLIEGKPAIRVNASRIRAEGLRRCELC